MSVHDNNFYSETLGQPARVTVILPEPLGPDGRLLPAYKQGPAPLPTVWLLHGLGGDATSWLRRTGIELLATQYRVAVVMPETGRGFYTNMVHGLPYWDYLTQELPARLRYVFPLSAAPQDNFVMGNSMGGYAALRWALTFPEQFAAVVALSPVTDIVRFGAEQAQLMPDLGLDFDLAHVANSPTDLAYLVAQLPVDTPLRALMTTGSADILRSMDTDFKFHLAAKLGSQFEWQQQTGQHDWNLWGQQLPFAMHWLIKGGWRRV